MLHSANSACRAVRVRCGSLSPLRLLCSTLLTAGCQAPPAASAPPVSLSFDEPVEVAVFGKPRDLIVVPEALLVLTQHGRGLGLFESRDGGKTWTPAVDWIDRATEAACYHAACRRLHGVARDDSAMVHRLLPTDRSPATITRAAHPPLIIRLDCTDPGRLGVIWVDRSSGWMELYFSQSSDEGKTWSPAALVNHESRGKPLLFVHSNLSRSNDAWNVIWSESRRPSTEFDLYASQSRDGSVWSPAIRINDDQTPGWQDFPAVTGRGGSLFVVFSDYRDLNRFGDREANIYFARVEPTARTTWPNVRVNDVDRGFQTVPRTALSSDGEVLVAGWEDYRNNLFGDVYASVSADGGKTWSANQRVNRNTEPLQTRITSLRPLPGNRFVFLYHQFFPVRRSFLRWAGVVEGAAVEAAGLPPVAQSGQRQAPLLQNLKAGSVLVENNFDADGLGLWRRLEGSWLQSDGRLLGFGMPLAVAGLSERPLRDFVFEGRFRLHPMEHRSAILGFRARRSEGAALAPDRLQGYSIWNHFRIGVKLYESGVRYYPEENILPLADRAFPFRNDTWYRFRLVVAGSALDYYIDDEWMLSFEGLSTEPGSLVLAADSPVEFDDLRVTSVVTEESTDRR